MMKAGQPGLTAALEPLLSAPAASAVLCDLDGTLAPIVSRPEEAALPDQVRDTLRRIAGLYALTAVVSGRPAMEARRIVGLDELAYSGNHGYELLLPGETEPRPDPSLAGHTDDALRFVAELDRGDLERAGISVEDKGAIIALHWRTAPNEGAAESLASEIASEAEWQGLVIHRGRKVLEIRPNVPVNKGIAVAALVPAKPVSAALFGGDDRTDADAFLALRTLQGDGELKAAVAIAVNSDEAPPELLDAADLVVEGTEGFREVLEALAGERPDGRPGERRR